MQACHYQLSHVFGKNTSGSRFEPITSIVSGQMRGIVALASHSSFGAFQQGFLDTTMQLVPIFADVH